MDWAGLGWAVIKASSSTPGMQVGFSWRRSRRHNLEKKKKKKERKGRGKEGKLGEMTSIEIAWR